MQRSPISGARTGIWQAVLIRSRQGLRLSIVVALTLLAAACGTDSGASTEADALATALRREQAIATFTAEAVISPTATRFPRVTPSSEPQEQPTATAAATPPAQGARSFTEEQLGDIEELEALLLVRSEAMSKGDFEAWYETCAPSIREQAIESDALGAQLRAIRFEPDQQASFEFVLEEVFFSGSTDATVLWGWRSGPSYFSGLGGQYVKQEGTWFSLGWGCAG